MTTPPIADQEVVTGHGGSVAPLGTRVTVSAPALRWSRSEIIGVGGLTGFVLFAAAWRLGIPSLSNDEAATWAISGHSFSDLFHVLTASGGDRGAGLYYAVMHLWIQVFGTGEVALRSLSVVAAGATVAPLYAVGRRLVGRRAASAAVLLFVTSPFYLAYARDARTYALAIFLVVVASWAFVRALESGTGRDWILYAILASVSVYVHWFAALVVLAHYASLVSLDPRRVAWRRVGMGAAVLAVLTCPIGILVLFESNNGIDWIAPLNVGELETLASTFTGTGARVGQLVFLVVLAAGFVSTVAATRRSRATSATRVPALVATWFLIPLLATLAISIFKPVLIPRYLIVALPGFALLVGLGLSRLTRKRVVPMLAGVVVLVVLGAHGYANIWGQAKRESWREIERTVSRDARPTDAIVVFPASSTFAFSYYARNDPRFGARLGPSWPTVTWSVPFNRDTVNQTALAAVAQLHSSVVWVVARDPHGTSVRQDAVGKPILVALQRALADRYTREVRIEAFSKSAVFLVRYSRPTNP